MRETKTACIELRDDGLLAVRIRRDAHQTVTDAEHNLEAAFSESGERRRPLLVDICGVRPLDPEVRHHYSGQVLVDRFVAFGLLIDASPLGRMMGNVYLLVARPGIPTQLFTDEARAVSWLKGFVG
jgi:hypothetical protein